jgi:DNA-binding NtrC family response regulator
MTARGAPFLRAVDKSGDVQLVGVSRQIVQLREQIERVARSDATILITGERGVGKETIAQGIHAVSARAGMDFVTVSCEGLPEALLESELFGHLRGRFTGAYRDNPGKLERADKGSVFLDEIGETTLRTQKLLVRFFETGELQSMGEHDGGRVVNVRAIAATNRNLPDMVRQGTFREDLFDQLNVTHLIVPPLRERPEDIPALVSHFLHIWACESESMVTSIDAEALNVLMRYDWPGNVRQLVNVLERLAVTGRDRVATAEDLPAAVRAQPSLSFRPTRDRRRTVADDLYQRLTEEYESFWSGVYAPYMNREFTRCTLREVVRRGLEASRGNYRLVARLFNIDARDYKRFLGFLRKQECQLPFKEFRQ